MKRVYLTVYRSLGFTFLTGITLAILFFFTMMLFFAANSSWVAPTHLSPTSDKMLTFNNAYQQALQNVSTVEQAAAVAQRNLQFAQQRLGQYSHLGGTLSHNLGNLQSLTATKSRDLQASRAIDANLMRNQGEIDRALGAGLISVSEAAEQRAAVQNFHNSLTDSSVSVNSAMFGGASGVTQVAMQVGQAQADIANYQSQFDSSQQLLRPAQENLRRLQRSAYFNAYRNNGADYAFIPYENLDKAQVGQPVYACLLMVIVCHKVGKIDAVYSDEQQVEFPIFNVKFSRTMRGTIVGLTMDPENRNEMGSKLFFVGTKPLLF